VSQFSYLRTTIKQEEEEEKEEEESDIKGGTQTVGM
jgi:hypothetical protein